MFVDKILSKMDKCNFFWDKSLSKNFSRQNLYFVEGIFNFFAEIGIFGHTLRVTLLSQCNLKTMRLKIIIFKICVLALGKKSQIVSLSTFDQGKVFNFKYFDK